MQRNIEGVAFDLDGTLYPNYRLNIKLIPFLLKEWRLVSAFGKARGIIRVEQERSIPQQDSFYEYQAKLVAKLRNVSAEGMQEKIEELIYRGWEPIFKKVKLFNKVQETLTALREAGYKLGILSDFPLEAKLEFLGITAFWDTVLCSENFNVLKPHPLPFIKLAQAMSLPPEKILYVGNSRSYDVAGANKAGMKTAWIKNVLFPGSGLRKPKPDFSFSNYRQLQKFVLHL
jgi:putative hydrolase of the HAD superfamily